MQFCFRTWKETASSIFKFYKDLPPSLCRARRRAPQLSDQLTHHLPLRRDCQMMQILIDTCLHAGNVYAIL